jgi:hypothetical protein
MRKEKVARDFVSSSFTHVVGRKEDEGDGWARRPFRRDIREALGVRACSAEKKKEATSKVERNM